MANCLSNTSLHNLGLHNIWTITKTTLTNLYSCNGCIAISETVRAMKLVKLQKKSFYGGHIRLQSCQIVFCFRVFGEIWKSSKINFQKSSKTFTITKKCFIQKFRNYLFATNCMTINFDLFIYIIIQYTTYSNMFSDILTRILIARRSFNKNKV